MHRLRIASTTTVQAGEVSAENASYQQSLGIVQEFMKNTLNELCAFNRCVSVSFTEDMGISFNFNTNFRNIELHNFYTTIFRKAQSVEPTIPGGECYYDNIGVWTKRCCYEYGDGVNYIFVEEKGSDRRKELVDFFHDRFFDSPDYFPTYNNLIDSFNLIFKRLEYPIVQEDSLHRRTPSPDIMLPGFGS